MNISLEPVILYSIAGGLGGLLLILIGVIVHLHLRIRRLLGSGRAKTLEDTLRHLHASLNEMEQFRGLTEEQLRRLENRTAQSIRGVHTVRFNPFRGTGSGGDQSFSTALVNEYGDGVVLSSLYSRERVSVFSKPLKSFVSTYELSEEEQAALQEARGQAAT